MSGFLKECIRMAFNTMKVNKLRTVLSLIGILIGVCALVTILSLGGSATKNMINNFSKGGIDIINIMPMNNKNTREIFTDEFSSTLKSNFQSIDDCIVTNSQGCTVRYGSEQYSATVVGSYSKLADFYSLKFSSGEFWKLEDNIASRQVCVIGEEVASELFNREDPVGKYIKILFRNVAKSFLVVGVIEEKDATSTMDFSSSVFVPNNTFTSRLKKVRTTGNYIVRIKDGYDPSAESDKIEAYLNSLVSTDGFNLFSLSSLREMVSSSMSTVTMFIAAIAAISLIVGGVGIMNIMLVSVAERTREIGILKAIGATPMAIELQFLLEAVFLSFIGGVLGIVLGIIIALIVSYALLWPASISFQSIVIGIVFSLLVGIFFGVYPARKASKLNPIQALSRD